MGQQIMWRGKLIKPKSAKFTKIIGTYILIAHYMCHEDQR